MSTPPGHRRYREHPQRGASRTRYHGLVVPDETREARNANDEGRIDPDQTRSALDVVRREDRSRLRMFHVLALRQGVPLSPVQIERASGATTRDRAQSAFRESSHGGFARGHITRKSVIRLYSNYLHPYPLITFTFQEVNVFR